MTKLIAILASMVILISYVAHSEAHKKAVDAHLNDDKETVSQLAKRACANSGIPFNSMKSSLDRSVAMDSCAWGFNAGRKYELDFWLRYEK